MRVLVADDDPYSAAMLEAVLTSAGHECVMAKDGREAWAIIESVDAPRIAFLDWMMPEIDGIELCRRIRERKDAEYVYVAVLSVRSKQRDVTLGFQAGVDDYITKPYQIEDVLARLQVAERLVRSARVHNGLRRALAEAAASPGGDVIVRGDQRVGRIIFHHGKIAWAHISDVPGSLAAILADEPGITREDIREVIEECGVSGANFADLLVSWDLITRERLRTVLLNWIRAKIATPSRRSPPRR
jgi:CheY-like chemotaxis protein